jgi:hypothetical protein
MLWRPSPIEWPRPEERAPQAVKYGLPVKCRPHLMWRGRLIRRIRQTGGKCIRIEHVSIWNSEKQLAPKR